MERLSGLDASFLYLETPTTPMHVAMMAVLDPAEAPGGYRFDAVVQLIEDRLHLVPPFRRRLAHVPLSLHHPLWVEDEHFDIIHHVRRVALPAPGGLVELADMAGRIASVPLDRTRPLWEAWVIEGLEGGRFAVMVKVHHCAVDGASGAGLMVHLFDMQRAGRKLRPAPPRVTEPLPSDAGLLRSALKERIRQPLGLLRLTAETLGSMRDMYKVRNDASLPSGATPLTAPRTRFNSTVAAQRGVAFARLPLAGLKELKNVAGAKVNDVVLAIVAGALRRYLRGHGELPGEPLIAVCPISVRQGAPKASEANNQVSAMFTSLATDIDSPMERLLAIQRVTAGAKEEHSAIGADKLQSWAEYAAPTTFNLAARWYSRLRLAERVRPIYNLVISNVPGPHIPLFLAGARLDAVYPMGPVLEDAGLNVTVISYLDHVDFGFMVAANLMPDVWDLAAAVEPAYLELREAAGI